MKLIYRIALRLSLILIPLMALWATLFYFMMVEEINDEADDTLEDYSELIIIRMLAGRELPSLNSGSNNSYSITPIDEAYASSKPHIEYYDAEVYIPEKEETEPARILSTIFLDNDDNYYELESRHTDFRKRRFGQDYFILDHTPLLRTSHNDNRIDNMVFHRNMRPLYALLHWLDNYIPGRHNTPVPNDTNISEFHKLNVAAQEAANRSEELFEQQKQFIGNASHELQTPLAILGNRLEWLLDNTELNETQIEELFKMQRTLGHIVRLNKTLLLLTKIENGQFPESTNIDLAFIIKEQISLYNEIYSSRNISYTINIPETFIVLMNESLASTLITNLLKNAYVHTTQDSNIEITLINRTLTIANDGTTPLDTEHIFERFYQGSKKEGSTGLGLALVKAVCRYYNLHIEYQFKESKHYFSITWP